MMPEPKRMMHSSRAKGAASRQALKASHGPQASLSVIEKFYRRSAEQTGDILVSYPTSEAEIRDNLGCSHFLLVDYRDDSGHRLEEKKRRIPLPSADIGYAVKDALWKAASYVAFSNQPPSSAQLDVVYDEQHKAIRILHMNRLYTSGGEVMGAGFETHEIANIPCELPDNKDAGRKDTSLLDFIKEELVNFTQTLQATYPPRDRHR